MIISIARETAKTLTQFSAMCQSGHCFGTLIVSIARETAKTLAHLVRCADFVTDARTDARSVGWTYEHAFLDTPTQ